jgi:glutaredoxin
MSNIKYTITPILLLLLGLFSLSVDTQAEIYKWVDENGQVHFGDSRPQEIESKQVTVKPNTYTSPSIEILSKIFETDSQPQQGSKNKNVIMYSAAWCGICKKARNYFKKNKILFKEYDVENSAKGKRDYKKLRGTGVPIILVNNKRMNGFSENKFRSLFNQVKLN